MRFETPIYLAACAAWLPATSDPAEEAVADGRYDADEWADSGYQSVLVSEDAAPPEMAARAAGRALERSGHEPADVALVLHASIYHQGHDFWSAASYVQRAIGADRAVSINVNQMCNGGSAALELAAAHLLADSSRVAALVSTGDRFAGPGFDRWRSDFGIAYGDGATATLLSTRSGPVRLLSSVTVTEPALEGMHRGDDAFSAAPRELSATIDVRRTKRAYLSRSAADLFQRAPQALAGVVDTALAEAGTAKEDLRLAVLPNLGRNVLQALYYPALDIDPARTLWALGARWGHLGAGDAAAGLAHALEHGMLAAGDRCLLLGAGGGFSWTATVVEVVDAPHRGVNGNGNRNGRPR